MYDADGNSFWTAVAALAGIGQVVVLIVTARFVFRYLQETERMRKATEKQVEKSQSLVALGHRQMEAQIKPAVVARVEARRFWAPAINSFTEHNKGDIGAVG